MQILFLCQLNNCVILAVYIWKKRQRDEEMMKTCLILTEMEAESEEDDDDEDDDGKKVSGDIKQSWQRVTLTAVAIR